MLNIRDPLAAEMWTAKLQRVRTTPCDCANLYPNGCITSFNAMQGWALQEASQVGGLLGSIGVGEGKTSLDIFLAMAIPGVKHAVLLIPSSLKSQLLRRDIPQWSQHFKVPNLAGGSEFFTGRPLLTVVTYEEFSTKKNTDLLSRLRPDLIITDEAQSVAGISSRTTRFLRAFQIKGEPPRSASHSGTLTRRALADFHHLAGLSLRDGSPLPLELPIVSEWGSALDAPTKMNPYPARPGVLLEWCTPEERDQVDGVQHGFRRRFAETRGVITTGASTLGVALEIAEREQETPPALLQAMADVRETECRPDGEELVDKLQIARCIGELSCGFFYRWKFPRGEPVDVIETWFKFRKRWFAEMRNELKAAREGYDSPYLITKAAQRWHEGYSVKRYSKPQIEECSCDLSEDGAECECGFVDQEPAQMLSEDKYDPHCSDGPLITFDSMFWPAWNQVKDTVKPESEAIWLDTWLAADAAAWGKEKPGIIWYEHQTFGDQLRIEAKKQGYDLPVYGGGTEASAEILKEKGTRSIAASMKAHGTGKNLQAFSRALLANGISNGAGAEQVIGREHRQGQKSEVVRVEIYQHNHVAVSDFAQARSDARYIERVTGSKQKLCYATYEGDLA